MFITNLFFFEVTFPTAPHTEVTEKGEIKYTEVARENVHKLEAYTSSLQDLAHLLTLIELSSSLDLLRSAHGEAHVRDGKWKLEESLQSKAALRWRGSWDSSSILTADSKMDRYVMDGLTVKLMNLLTTKRSKVVMRRISCFMLASVLSVSAIKPFYLI